MKSKLSALKHHLFIEAGRRDDFDMNDANLMVSNTTEAAYQSLSDEDRMNINQMRNTLVAKIPRLGDVGALELLAALAEYVEA